MRLPTLPSAAALSRFTPLVVLAIALSVLATLYLRIDEASYKPLFGAREQVPTETMLSVLDDNGIAYRLDPDTGQVLVPAGKVGRARVVLAAKGVTARLPAGLEQVEDGGPLGTSQFVQQIRFRRALEAELARSIAALDPVADARVHLSIARSTSFVTPDGESSSASVVVTLHPGQSLSKEQIAAVLSLVAGSTPNLARERVALVDQRGALLSAHVDLDDATMIDGDGAQRVRERTLRNIHDLLAPVIGTGNYRASVTAEINADRVEETREQYGDAPRMLNEAVRDERDTELAATGVPGTLSNRPPPLPASDPQATTGVARNAATRQFAYDRSVVQIKRARGRIEKLSVAVVLNNRAAPDVGKAWSTEQLASIERLLRGGLGLDAARGDQLVVSALGFPSEPSPLPWWQREDNVERAIRYGTFGALGLFAFLLIVRPLLRGFLHWLQHRYASVPPGGVGGDHRSGKQASAQGGGAGLGQADTAGLSVLRGVDLPSDDSGTEVMLAHVQKLAEKEPERVAEVVKQWVKH